MAQVSTTQGQLYIVEMKQPFSTLQIQFVPGEIKNPRQGKFQDITVVGNNDEIQHYISARENLSLTLDFLAAHDNVKEVYEKINWLKSLIANDSYAGSFRSVKLVMGDLFKNQVWNIRSVNPVMSHFSAGNNWLPLRATIQIDFALDPEKNRYIDDIRNGR